MTKIKNFRISIRAREVARQLRHLGQDVSDPEILVRVEERLIALRPLAEPAAMYATLPKGEAMTQTTVALPKKAVALSLVAISVGTRLAAARDAAGTPEEALFVTAVEQEAKAQALGFTLRLIQNQATAEDCELADVQTPEPSQIQTLYSLLSLDRIGLPAETWPGYADARVVAWLPLRRTAKAAS